MSSDRKILKGERLLGTFRLGEKVRRFVCDNLRRAIEWDIARIRLLKGEIKNRPYSNAGSETMERNAFGRVSVYEGGNASKS